jgi:AmmeMemoRadiSam system protein B
VVLVGVFHRYRRFGVRDVLVFDSSRAWRAPDGEIPTSPLRDEVLRRMPPGSAIQSAAMHDSEHSLEALAYWLRHQRPDLEILPVIVPAARFDRLAELGRALGGALAEACRARGLALGRDVAFAISTDGVHYGSDFSFTPFGEGGVDAYVKATAQDEAILRDLVAGPVTEERVAALSARFVDPVAPDTYRLTWCGRFAVPLGMLALGELARATGLGQVSAVPIAYATSVGAPELPVRDLGLSETAPANLYHFVGYPAAAITLGE